MGTVLVDLSMSLDGFITGPNPDAKHALGTGKGEQLHKWFFSGTKPSPYSDMFKAEGASRAVVDAMFETTGAIVVGRNWYDIINGWDGNHPIDGVVVVVLTHTKPDRVPQGKTKFIFVTDGIESAVQQAQAAAGDKNVTVGGANVAQQALKAGLLDAIYLHVVPVLLGEGTRLFDNFDSQQFELDDADVVQAPGVTHMRFKVMKEPKK